jgi:biopolymer transport protein TolR
MKMSQLDRRKARKARNHQMVDMNLVSLIDIFTLLIFFLLANGSEVETIPNTKAVKLPESTAEKSPRETVVVVVTNEEIVVQGRRVAMVEEVLANEDDLIAPLQAELALQAGKVVVRRQTSEQMQAKGQAVTILGDRQIPYRLLRKVMVTCARSNFGDISFAVQRKNKA